MNKTKIILIVIGFLISIFDAKTQNIQLSKNSIFVEIFGNGGLYSINYERKFSTNIYGRIGFASFTGKSFFGAETNITSFPVLITYLSGQGKNHLEIGGGLLLGVQNEKLLLGNQNENGVSTPIIDITSFLGYRFQAPGKGFQFRIGLTPFLSLDKDSNYPGDGLMLSGGISLGYHF